VTRLAVLALFFVGAGALRSNLSAQAPGKEFNFGMTGGVSFSTFGGTDAGSPDSRTGIMAGAFVFYQAWDAVSVEAEGVYTQKGGSGITIRGVVQSLKIGYIEFPLFLDLHSRHQEHKLSPHAFGGAYGGFRVSCKTEVNQSSLPNPPASGDCDIVGPSIRGTDFGLVGGIGINFGNFAIDGRYEYGLNSIDGTGPNLDITNRVLSFTASYRIGSYK
jgi:outer membrane protein with beta-barrel domain